MVFGLVMTFGSALSAAIAAVTVTGTVRDSSGAPVAAAEVALLTPELAGIARTTTNPQGRFTFAVPAPGTYLLIVRAKAFDEVQRAFTAIDGQESAIDIVIQPEGLREEVTVTASRGTVEELHRAGQAVNIIDEREIGARVKTVVAQAIEGARARRWPESSYEG